ncbi:MAG: PP2C family protein-serine/threonine phosphatase, partial [Candidatus Promineifilaceae bacterium]
MPTQESSRFYQLTMRLWPETAQMDERRRDRAVKTIVQLVYLTPFALAGLILMLVMTDYGFLAENMERHAILFAALVLLLIQPFRVRIRLDHQGNVFEIASSLAPLVMWSSLFISGAAGLWAMVLAAGVASIWHGLQLARYREKPAWEPLSSFAQYTGTYVFGTVVAALIYLSMGEVFPMESTNANDWIPALVTIIIGALLSGLPMLLMGIQLEKLVDGKIKVGNVVRFYLGYVALPLIMGPFSIMIALLSREDRTVSLIFALIGIWMVNRLAYFLSEADARSRRQAREFTELESLAQSLIQAPADASTLRDVLIAYIPKMFPMDRAEILLFESEEQRAWSPFQILQPQDAIPLKESIWEQLRSAKESYIVLPGVKLEEAKRTFGEGLLVKILPEDAGEEAEPRPIGGIYLLRHGSRGKTSDSIAAVQSLASQVASALYRAEAHAKNMAFYKTQQELEFAGRVQHSFLPSSIPNPEHWQISANLVPARQTSGDYYDFIPLTDNLLGIVVADVSDKGTGAALYMALTRTLIRTYAIESDTEPESALTRANERIFTDTVTDQFVTL